MGVNWPAKIAKGTANRAAFAKMPRKLPPQAHNHTLRDYSAREDGAVGAGSFYSKGHNAVVSLLSRVAPALTAGLHKVFVSYERFSAGREHDLHLHIPVISLCSGGVVYGWLEKRETLHSLLRLRYDRHNGTRRAD